MKTIVMLALGLLATPGFAQSDLFRAKEWSIDALGSYATRSKNGGGNDQWGVGAGINYFFTRSIGIGADTFAETWELPYLVNFSGIYRHQLRDGKFAIYGYAGVGRQWDNLSQWLGHLGGGAEFRFKPTLGAFADIREEFPDRTGNFTVFRFGVRFTFK